MKQANTNPAIYVIYVFVLCAMVYFFFFGGYQSVAYPIPFSVLVFAIFGYTSFYFLRPYHPIKKDGNTLTIYINFLYKKVIQLDEILSVASYNRYDRFIIMINKKKISISFLLNRDDLIKDIKKSIKSRQVKNIEL